MRSVYLDPSLLSPTYYSGTHSSTSTEMKPYAAHTCSPAFPMQLYNFPQEALHFFMLWTNPKVTFSNEELVLIYKIKSLQACLFNSPSKYFLSRSVLPSSIFSYSTCMGPLSSPNVYQKSPHGSSNHFLPETTIMQKSLFLSWCFLSFSFKKYYISFSLQLFPYIHFRSNFGCGCMFDWVLIGMLDHSQATLETENDSNQDLL